MPTEEEVKKALSPSIDWGRFGQGAKMAAGIPPHLYNIIKTLSKSNYQPGANTNENLNTIHRAADFTTSLMMGAPKPSGAFGMAGGKGPTWFTPEKLNQLRLLEAQYPKNSKKIVEEFRAANPDIPEHIKDSYIIDVKNKNRLLGGINLDTGAASTKPMGPKESPFGPPSGPTANTPQPMLTGEPSSADAIRKLQEMQPVTKDYVKALGEDMGLSVGEYMAKGYKGEGKRVPQSRRTTYVNLKDPDNPANKVTVRVPGPNDTYRHYGAEQEKHGRTMFDTGYGYPPELQVNTPNPRPLNPSNTMNISNQSYAHPKELEEALRLQFFGKAPGGDLRLVSPEYAKLPREVNVAESPMKPDPKQLKLLSGGYTPADILQILKQQQGQNGPQT